MLLKLSVYLLFSIALWNLPEQFFNFLLNFLTDINKKTIAYYQKIPVHSVVYSGNALLIFLSEFEGSLSCGLINQKKEIPQFKFYTDLLLKLLEANRQEGIGLRKLIPELRLGIQRDIQFEKKISKEMVGGFFQFFIITLTTWGFIFFSQSLVEIKMQMGMRVLIITLQVLGFLLFALMAFGLRKKQFKAYTFAFRELYLFSSLIEVRLPIKTILDESQILTGSLVSFKHFHFLAKRIFASVERWKTSGMSPKEESEELIKELWYSQEEQFMDFIKKLQIIKFILMAVLFLPAYFLYLASIFKFFMEQ